MKKKAFFTVGTYDRYPPTDKVTPEIGDLLDRHHHPPTLPNGAGEG